MLRTDYEILTQIIVAIFIIAFFIKFIYSLYQRKNAIVIAVDNCTGCPFKKEWDANGVMTKYNCDLKKIMDQPNMSHTSNHDLFKTCPIQGKFEILIYK